MKNSRGRLAPRETFIREISFSKFNFVHVTSLPGPARFCRICAALAVIVLFFLAGCAQKPLTRSQIHIISGEITAAAQDVTSRKPDITIRPDFRPVAGAPKGQGPADSISISLDDDSHMGALRQAFREIARRHGLLLAENSADGVVRFNFTFAGTRTHIVYVVTPAAARSRASALPSAGGSAAGPKLAIILDDLGSDRAGCRRSARASFSADHLRDSALAAFRGHRRRSVSPRRSGDFASADAGAGAGRRFRVNRIESGNERGTGAGGAQWNVQTVPHAVGANNHQGSRATSDPALMGELMPALHARGLFFIDSRTTASTVAYDAAERANVPAASRKVFLDDTPQRAAILAQLDLAAKDAMRDGSAIAIGHPHPATIAALSEAAPRLEARGIHLVFASDLVH